MALHRLPLAWRNLVHDRPRLLVIVAGIAFAVVLMFTELGFWNALLDSMAAVIDRFDADVVMVNADKTSIAFTEPFTRRRIEQARGAAGVASVWPLYLEIHLAPWKNRHRHDPDEASVRRIRVLACDPASDALLVPELAQHADDLKLPDTVLMDRRSREFFGDPAPGLTAELANRHVRVVGTFELGTDFVNDGTLIMSEQNYARFFPRKGHLRPPLSQVEVGLIKLTPGADPALALASLRRALPEDVVVLTRADFAAAERRFWQRNTPIGFVFGLGLAMGFVVGVIICYQVLSADLADHLPEFATLKAMGYHDSYLNRVVLQEGLLLAAFGYLPGLGLSLLVYRALGEATGLTLRLSLVNGVLVLVLTIAMCVVSGLLAVRKVKVLDPAEVF